MSRRVTAYVAIAVLALVARLLFLGQIDDTVYWDHLMGDAQSYDLWAQRIVDGAQEAEVFYQAPLYPYWLASIYASIGPNLGAVRLIQVALSVLACLLLAEAGRGFFADQRVGLLAGLLLAVYPPAIFFDSLILRTSLALFLFMSLIWLLSLAHGPGRARAVVWLGCGIVGGCLMLARENAAVVVLCALAWVWWGEGKSRQRSLIACALLFGGVVLALLPVGIRNYRVAGELQLTGSSLGPNFYIGNHEGADGIYRPLWPGRGHISYERRDASLLAELATGQTLDAGEVSRFWLGRSLSYIRSQPLDWARLLGRKTLLLLNRTEIADTQDLYSYAEHAPPLAWLHRMLNQGVLWPLAAIGLVAGWRDRRRWWVLGVMLAAYSASVVAFFVFARYRFLAVPLLMLFAAQGVVALPGLIRERRWILPTIVALVVAGLANWPMGDVDVLRATTAFNMGARLAEETGGASQARDHYERSLELDPAQPAAWTGLGLLLAREERWDEARRHFEKALELDPASADAHYNLGVVHERERRREPAVSSFEAALRHDPLHADAHQALGTLLDEENRLAEAEEHLRQAVRIDSGHYKAWNSLGILHARQSNLPEAIRCFEAALEARPDFEGARQNLQRARSMIR